MNARKQVRATPVSEPRQTPSGSQSRPAVAQPKRAVTQPPSVMRRVTRGAPPAYRPQAAPKVLQAKVQGAPQPANNRSGAAQASGVVQANVIGGTHALQARLNAWHTRPTRNPNQSASPINAANFAQTRGTPNATIQRKSGPGVEAFRVPLQQKSGGLPIESNCSDINDLQLIWRPRL